MNHRLISASFVGIWESPLPHIPNLSRKYCLDFFEDPYETNSGITHEGLVITKISDSLPIENLLINSNRLQISCKTIDYLIDKTLTIYNTLSQMYDNLLFPFSSIGINTEQEWLDLPFSSQEWMFKKFFINPFSEIENIETVQPYHIRLDLKKTNSMKFNLYWEPRANLNNGLFMGLNNEHFWSEKSIPSRNELKDMYIHSIDEMKILMHRLFQIE
jgi:hypothetical protein